ncbi:ABC transporter ATP-binding protein [Nocardioides panacisoli]|uniref:ABC transporter ATP-binding protein n=1 Tax=Nocardioides panacisoli TaxID=627624 RepID=UPI001C62737A|nr:ABC transporter ATP-binding protein [Nocardioides panacisoli]QYJ04190.1 ABC transporter ATP-binding protein [Nocardioides panacisoli]
MTTSLTAENLVLGYDRHDVVHDLTLAVPTGRVTAIVGANGCGKSTLLRGLSRLLRPRAGRVLLGEQELHRMSHAAVARHVGLLPQQPIAPEGITVADLVSRGRYPHQGMFSRWVGEDDAIVADAMTRTGISDLAERRIDELSGGQRQRVWIAMVLAQQPEVLLLDEPTTYLDVAHQVEILDLLREVNGERGTTVVMVLHELNLAARYADHMVVMTNGRIHAEGAPGEVLTEATVRDAFGLDAVVAPDPVTAGPMVVPRCGPPSRVY